MNHYIPPIIRAPGCYRKEPAAVRAATWLVAGMCLGAVLVIIPAHREIAELREINQAKEEAMRP